MEVTLYTSQPEADAQKLADGFKGKYLGVDVTVFRSGTEKVVSKLLTEAEAGAVEADVLLLADAPAFEILKGKKLLESYKSPEAARVDAAFIDPETRIPHIEQSQSRHLNNSRFMWNIASFGGAGPYLANPSEAWLH